MKDLFCLIVCCSPLSRTPSHPHPLITHHKSCITQTHQALLLLEPVELDSFEIRLVRVYVGRCYTLSSIFACIPFQKRKRGILVNIYIYMVWNESVVNGDCNLISVRRTTYEPLLTVYPQFPPPYPFQIPPQYRESRSARSMATRGPSSWTPLKRQNNSPNGSYSPPSSWYVCGRADASTLSSFLLVSLSIQFNSIQKERDISKYHSRNRKCGGVRRK